MFTGNLILTFALSRLLHLRKAPENVLHLILFIWRQAISLKITVGILSWKNYFVRVKKNLKKGTQTFNLKKLNKIQ